MKRLPYYLTIFFLGVMTHCIAQHQLNDVKWLSGEWKRLNMTAGKSGSESWTIASDSLLLGMGTTIRGADTLFVEKLKIVLRKNLLYYVADIAENDAPVAFKLIAVTPKSFTCENLQHDFPKRIAYSLEDNRLKAVISGNGKSVEYWFERIK